MKTLLTFCLALPMALFAQEGVCPEQLVAYPLETGTLKTYETKRIKLRTGVNLEYVENGNPDGVPLILLHGLSDSWHSFQSVLPTLPAGIRAFAISQRGHGDSERPAAGYAPKDFAADIAAFIEQLHLGPVIVAGHSMGGVNAQQFAISYPRLLKALVIIDSDPYFINNPGMPEFLHEVMELKEVTRAFMEAFQQSTLAKPIDTSYFNLLVNEGMKVPVEVIQKAFSCMLKHDFTSELKKIDRPALVFWGDRDAFCHKQGQESFEANLKNGRLLVYRGTGHALHWEEPERFASDLVHFIDQVQKGLL